MSGFKTVRGMRDFLPEEASLMKSIESKARDVANNYGYKELITPVVESHELLAAKAGEEVRSRMFVFKDLGGRDVALRPEFTASVARVVATTLRNEPKPFRLFSVGTIYRYDEPQRGRYREFWQSNYELMGSVRPEADVELILLTQSLINSVGLKDCAFKIGHVGILRAIFAEEKLVERTQSTVMQLMDKKLYDDAINLLKKAKVSDKCLETVKQLTGLKGTDAFGIIENIRKTVESYISAAVAVKNLFEILRLILESRSNVEIMVDAGFARGLEYYTGMIFEIYVPDLGIALGGGGRYDRLIELFGGQPTPAVGVAHGLDRIMLAMQDKKAPAEMKPCGKVVVVPASEGVAGDSLRVAKILRDAGVPVELEVMGRKMAKALEDADRRGAAFAVIIGEKELKEESVVLRNLRKREQKVVQIVRIADALSE